MCAAKKNTTYCITTVELLTVVRMYVRTPMVKRKNTCCDSQLREDFEESDVSCHGLGTSRPSRLRKLSYIMLIDVSKWNQQPVLTYYTDLKSISNTFHTVRYDLDLKIQFELSRFDKLGHIFSVFSGEAIFRWWQWKQDFVSPTARPRRRGGRDDDRRGGLRRGESQSPEAKLEGRGPSHHRCHWRLLRVYWMVSHSP